MAGRQTIAFKGTEAQKARIDDVADDLGLTRSDLMESVVMSYVEHHERGLTHDTEIANIQQRTQQLSSAVRRLDVARAVEEVRA